MKTSRCRGCGAEIIWAVNPETGAKIPIDVRPVVWHVIDCGDGRIEVFPAEAQHEIGVSHFATCPKASEFSKGARK